MLIHQFYQWLPGFACLTAILGLRYGSAKVAILHRTLALWYLSRIALNLWDTQDRLAAPGPLLTLSALGLVLDVSLLAWLCRSLSPQHWCRSGYFLAAFLCLSILNQTLANLCHWCPQPFLSGQLSLNLSFNLSLIAWPGLLLCWVSSQWPARRLGLSSL